MTVHDFQRSLALSQEQVDAPWWEPVYRQAFPSFVGMRSVRDDGWAQRGGIDRLIDLADGTSLKVDEKVRQHDYQDILLEAWSDYERQIPGWIEKDLTCDYIAYAFIPSRTCFLLPFHTLRRAWLTNKQAWTRAAEDCRDGFRVVVANNGRYRTWSYAIPKGVLRSALVDSMVVRWGRSA